MWFRQMAQLSTTMSQAQRATAFHYEGISYLCRASPPSDLTFFTSNLFLLSAASAAPAFAVFDTVLALDDVASAVASCISTSAILYHFVCCNSVVCSAWLR